MASFSDENLIKKLADLNSSQQSIQTLSLWLIHHRKHSRNIVETWSKELRKVRPSKKLTFLYLANDVIQNSKKKGPEFNRDFRLVLPETINRSMKESDEKVKGSIERLINIWKERGVFEPEFISQLHKPSAGGVPINKALEKVKAELGRERQMKRTKDKKSDKKSGEPPSKKKKKPELSLKEEIEQELAGETLDPPGADELVKALQDLENSASSDATVREKIAGLPPEVSDVSHLQKIKDKESGDKLTKTVNEAVTLLNDYNSRLSSELAERKRVAKLLRTFIDAQKEALTEDEKKLQEARAKLDQVDGVRKELKSHMQSLPDLTLLPDVTAGLAPLPSVGDLFELGL